jgi:hypothetical protein
MGAANIRSIQAIQDLRAALTRFAADAADALRAADLEVRHAVEYLQQRQLHWEREVRQCRDELERAQAAFTACRAQAYRDAEGRVYIPPCTAEQARVQQAQAALQTAMTELANASAWLRRVEDAEREYRRQAQRIGATLSSDVPRATASLGTALSHIEGYAGGAGGIGAAAGAIVGGLVGAVAGALAGGGAAANPDAAGHRGTREVPLDQIDLSDSTVHGPGDFTKVPYDEVVAGLRTLESEIRPAVARGADGDYFARLDAQRGLDYAHGTRRIYDAFYGDTAIHLERRGAGYGVINGFHRLYVARALGITSLPARVAGE